MSEETNPTPQGSEASETPSSNVPQDFKGYVKWRQTGEPPAEPEATTPPAAAEETPAKTEPQSGAEETQQPDKEEEIPEEELTVSQKRRRRRVEKLTQENAELRAQLAAALPKAPEPPKPAPPPGEPRLETFETLEEYQKALTKFFMRQEQEERAAEAERKAAIEAEQKLLAAWDSKKQEARKAHPDFDDVVESTAAPEGPGVAAGIQAMHDDPAGAEILYFLGTHPDELKRIAALSPIAAVREIGRLSAILSPPSEAANGKQRFTAAPKPPPPNTRPGKTVSDSIDDPAVQQDFKRWSKARMAQLKGR